jgi:hypothetical protein
MDRAGEERNIETAFHEVLGAVVDDLVGADPEEREEALVRLADEAEETVGATAGDEAFAEARRCVWCSEIVPVTELLGGGRCLRCDTVLCQMGWN